MQEISPHVFIDTSYAGVTLGAINWTHGLILIDAPFRPDDIRSWRSALLNLGGGVDRLLINLDAHFDRTLGVRAMDSTVLAQERIATIFRNRPVTFKVQGADTGADWELYNGLGSIRWAPPDLTFDDHMYVHWDESPLLLEHRPGPASGATWVILPQEGILFLGDAVVANQPPFLANADLPAWIASLKFLLSGDYQSLVLVSGRGGVITTEQVRQQLALLEQIDQALENLAARKAAPEDTSALVDQFLPGFNPPANLLDHYRQRLHWGLQQCYARRNRMIAAESEE